MIALILKATVLYENMPLYIFIETINIQVFLIKCMAIYDVYPET